MYILFNPFNILNRKTKNNSYFNCIKDKYLLIIIETAFLKTKFNIYFYFMSDF